MNPQKKLVGIQQCACIVLGLLIALAPDRGWSGTPAPLPPAAQEAVDKGIAAAKRSDYPEAIKDFEEARKISPDAAVVYQNLGLAESKIPGRELRAMAWFGAYLAADPAASNAAAVKEQIAALDAANKNKVTLMVKTMEDQALKIPKSEWWLQEQLTGDERQMGLEDVIELRAGLGDFTGAFRITDEIPNHFSRCWSLYKIGTAQAEAGDVEEAQKTFALGMKAILELKPDHVGPARMSVLASNFAWGHAGTGDFAGALQSASVLKDAYLRSQAQFTIAQQQARTGDMPGFQTTYVLAAETASHIKDSAQKKEVQDWIKEQKAKIDSGKKDDADDEETKKLHPPTALKDWASQNETLMNDPVFLDFEGTLKDINSGKYDSYGSYAVFSQLRNATKKIADARQLVTRMVAEQGK